MMILSSRARIISLIAVVALIVGGAALFFNQPVSQAPVVTEEREVESFVKVSFHPAVTPADTPRESVEGDVWIGAEPIFVEEVPSGSTAFSTLQSAVKKAGIPMEFKSYGDMGVLITKIGSYEGGEGGKYWQYYVNGKYGTIAADKQPVKAGDKIEWKFLGPNEQ